MRVCRTSGSAGFRRLQKHFTELCGALGSVSWRVTGRLTPALLLGVQRTMYPLGANQANSTVVCWWPNLDTTDDVGYQKPLSSTHATDTRQLSFACISFLSIHTCGAGASVAKAVAESVVSQPIQSHIYDTGQRHGYSQPPAGDFALAWRRI